MGISQEGFYWVLLAITWATIELVFDARRRHMQLGKGKDVCVNILPRPPLPLADQAVCENDFARAWNHGEGGVGHPTIPLGSGADEARSPEGGGEDRHWERNSMLILRRSVEARYKESYAKVS